MTVGSQPGPGSSAGAVAVVTGAARGIGKAIATSLCGYGWQVVVVDRPGEALSRWQGSPGIAGVVAGDVCDDETLAAAARLAGQAGLLTAWVNNAALIEQEPLHAASASHIDRMLATDLRAYLAGSRLAVQGFLATGAAGSIVSVSSVHSRLAFAGYALYDICKAGVDGMTRTIAAEYGDRGIRANSVAPGAVMTEAEEAARRATPPAFEPIPLRMFSAPREIAEVVAFLASPLSAAINGAVIAADRGLSTTFLPTAPGAAGRQQGMNPARE
jgi:NAD(P)-dependent dehydrogenase (short-subunit alcohol dehydrogenase family)